MKRSNILVLESTKENTLKEFLVSYTYIITKAVPTKSILRKLHLNGIIYRNTNVLPYLDAILMTCTDTTISYAQESLLYDTFAHMYRELTRVGRFTNEFLHSI